MVVDPLQLRDYVEYMEEATGVESTGYSVTLPPFENGDPSIDNQDAIIDAGLLSALNVKYVLARFSIDSDELELIDQDSSSYLYQNQRWRPRAVLYPSGQADSEFTEVQIREYSANRIVLITEAQGLPRIIRIGISRMGSTD